MNSQEMFQSSNLSTSNHISSISSGYFNLKDETSSKRTQSVKHCKKLSQNGVFNSDGLRGQSLRKFSNSTPNIKNITFIDGLSNNEKRKYYVNPSDHRHSKTSIKRFYSQESLGKNQNCFKQINSQDKSHIFNEKYDSTRSLDRMSLKSKCQTFPNTVHDKPFYPPGKYSNIHDKANLNLQRLINARNQYKTPESRKLLHNSTRKKHRIQTLENSVSNSSDLLNQRHSSFISESIFMNNDDQEINDTYPYKPRIKLRINSLYNNNDNIDQMDYSPQISMYRNYNYGNSGNVIHPRISRPISVNFHYPITIPNPFYDEFHGDHSNNAYFQNGKPLEINATKAKNNS